jgi:hypothetical protein
LIWNLEESPMKEQLTSKQSAMKSFVPFMIGAVALLSGCLVAEDPVDDADPEPIGTVSEASVLFAQPSESVSPFAQNFPNPAGWPLAIVDSLGISGSFDNNGANVRAEVVVTFSNGDPALSLSGCNGSRSSTYVSLTCSGTWVPWGGSAVTINTQTRIFDGSVLLGGPYFHTYSSTVTPPPAPVVNAGGIVNASNYSTIIHPGDHVAIFGSNLSTSTASCGAASSCGGSQVIIGGYQALISYASPGQINAIVPTSVPYGNFQLIVSSGGALSTPAPITLQ